MKKRQLDKVPQKTKARTRDEVIWRTSTQQKENVQHKKQDQYTCYNCGKVGHQRKDCKSCGFCTKFGHKAKDCKQRIAQAKGKYCATCKLRDSHDTSECRKSKANVRIVHQQLNDNNGEQYDSHVQDEEETSSDGEETYWLSAPILSAQAWAYAPYIDVDFYGRSTRAFIDSGAFTTILSAHLFSLTPFSQKDLTPCPLNVLDANGHRLPILGSIPARVQTPVGHFIDSVLVFQAEQLVQHDVLLGVNILRLTNIDLAHSTLSFFRHRIEEKRLKDNKNSGPQKYVMLNLASESIKGLEEQNNSTNTSIDTVHAVQGSRTHLDVRIKSRPNSAGQRTQPTEATPDS